jgi:hypothetical protein
VQALDVALVMSMVFSLIVMTFWRFDIMSIYAKGKGAQLRIGDPKLLAPWNRADTRDALEREAAAADGMKPDGLVIIRAVDGEAGRRAIETVAGRLAAEWRSSEVVTEGGIARVDTVVRLRKDVDPAELIAELEARWSDDIAAAQYIPLSTPSTDK